MSKQIRNPWKPIDIEDSHKIEEAESLPEIKMNYKNDQTGGKDILSSIAAVGTVAGATLAVVDFYSRRKDVVKSGVDRLGGKNLFFDLLHDLKTIKESSVNDDQSLSVDSLTDGSLL